jgi:hypothetical protein
MVKDDFKTIKLAQAETRGACFEFRPKIDSYEVQSAFPWSFHPNERIIYPVRS